MSDSKFDDRIRETLEGHEPEATPNWEKMRDRIAAAAAIGAMGVDAAGSKIATQLSIGAAVVLGAASMWVAQQFVELEDDISEESVTEIVEFSDDHMNNSSDNEAILFDANDADASEVDQQSLKSENTISTKSESISKRKKTNTSIEKTEVVESINSEYLDNRAKLISNMKSDYLASLNNI